MFYSSAYYGAAPTRIYYIPVLYRYPAGFTIMERSIRDERAMRRGADMPDWFDSDSVYDDAYRSSSISNSARSTPVRKRAYIAVAILFAVNLLNYMDRYTIAGVLLEVQSFYNLDAKQEGLIQTAFIASYMLLAPIFGYLGDRYNRRMILTIGILLWSLTTFAGSLVPREHFLWFLFLRACVGIGEASYSTIAPTIIADLFTNERRSKMLAVFYFAIPVGSGLGYIVGSAVAKAFGGWQWALRVTPVLGIVLDILIFFCMEDPPRGEAEGAIDVNNGSDRRDSWLDDVKALGRNSTYILTTLGSTCVAFTAGALAIFAPSFMTRAFSLLHPTDEATIALIFGVITCVAGFVGVALGSVSSQCFRRYSGHADSFICAFGLLAAAPFLFLSLLLSGVQPTGTWFLIFVGEALLCMTWPIVADMLLYVVPPTRRSTAEALQILVMHALGDAGSPYLIGVVSDLLVGRRPHTDYILWHSMRTALYSTCFVCVLGGLCFLWSGVYVARDRLLCESETKMQIELPSPSDAPPTRGRHRDGTIGALASPTSAISESATQTTLTGDA